MGETLRCARCNKGIRSNEHYVWRDDEPFHKKCAERNEKGKK